VARQAVALTLRGVPKGGDLGGKRPRGASLLARTLCRPEDKATFLVPSRLSCFTPIFASRLWFGPCVARARPRSDRAVGLAASDPLALRFEVMIDNRDGGPPLGRRLPNLNHAPPSYHLHVSLSDSESGRSRRRQPKGPKPTDSQHSSRRPLSKFRTHNRIFPGLALSILSACAELAPPLSESDIPASRTIIFHYDQSRHQVLSEQPLTADQQRVVQTVSRAGTVRFIEARSAQTMKSADGSLSGDLVLHQGWRQEFFPLRKETYENADHLPAGQALYYDPDIRRLYRTAERGWFVRGRSDDFTGLITRILEVPVSGSYSFAVNSDDGTIGTLQNLTQALQDVRLLWFDWRPQGGDGFLEVEDQFLEAGTYLLTVHYFEEGGYASYHIEYSRQVVVDSLPEQS